MRVVLATLSLLLLSVAALAQSDRGTITGTVKDPADAVVVGATVIARNLGTGAEHRTVTTETGNYTLASLPAGDYELQVETSGFKKHIAQGVKVQLNQTTRINATLEVGSASERLWSPVSHRC